jgi:hypothetical protein
MKTFNVIFSKECTHPTIGTFTFTKIASKSEECAILGVKGTSETYFFFGNKLHQEGAEVEIDPTQYHIELKDYTTPDGKELQLKYLKAKKA